MRATWIVVVLAGGLLAWSLSREAPASHEQTVAPVQVGEAQVGPILTPSIKTLEATPSMKAVKGTYLLEFELPQAEGQAPIKGRFVVSARGGVTGTEICDLGLFGFDAPAQSVLRHTGPFEIKSTSVITTYNRDGTRNGTVKTTSVSQGDTGFEELSGSFTIEVFAPDQDPLDENAEPVQILNGTTYGTRLIVE